MNIDAARKYLSFLADSPSPPPGVVVSLDIHEALNGQLALHLVLDPTLSEGLFEVMNTQGALDHRLREKWMHP